MKIVKNSSVLLFLFLYVLYLSLAFFYPPTYKATPLITKGEQVTVYIETVHQKQDLLPKGVLLNRSISGKELTEALAPKTNSLLPVVPDTGHQVRVVAATEMESIDKTYPLSPQTVKRLKEVDPGSQYKVLKVRLLENTQTDTVYLDVYFTKVNNKDIKKLNNFFKGIS